MPDITMCKGDGCDLRVQCYRHVAAPSTRGGQSWFVKPPNKEPSHCDYFIVATEKEIHEYNKRKAIKP